MKKALNGSVQKRKNKNLGHNQGFSDRVCDYKHL
jgi:hypothetical protein